MKNYSIWSKNELIKEIEALHKLINKQKNEIGKLRNEDEYVQKLKIELNRKLSEEYSKQTKNERGAGRKSKLTKEIAIEVKKRKREGMTFRKIADAMNISLGLTYKAYKSDN